MKYLIGALTVILLLVFGFWGGLIAKDTVFRDSISILFTGQPKEEKVELSIYYIENLTDQNINTGKLEIVEQTQDKDKFNSFLFKYTFKPNPKEHYEKSTTGVINVPKEATKPSLILMIRGYVDQDYFISGAGTRRSSEFFAENGFITIAPDYLGYGGSDEEAGNIFETRFQTYTTTLSLLKALEQLNSKPELLSCHSELDSESCDLINSLFDISSIFLWAHSNGGQIALTTLAVTQKSIPTVLWAPVTTPFPYSVLYYTNQSDDGGIFIRSELSKLEEYNDVDKFSFTNYLDRINAPILIFQGTADDAIPVDWSRAIVADLNNSFSERKIDLKAELIIKEGADHNLVPLWEETVGETLEFYNNFLD